ncbi:MAG: LuxR C-terminal-related transcriptional regulator [Sagittula sp.]|jgi:DNA-binding NarL/FixJ family response regulator|uniref:LuxR C-terminal-related transcriptional regulator n=1 Tax=unclassified Sagittula TaxID=2624628 RepID=UPI000C2D1356|nr:MULTISPECIES: response regulator transcription factor [unclassified Sagittula]AUC56099.1 DNA-binding response regulator [Sagittula sp. P11]WHZ38015.1 response regulator transcription factor [Sagittula sp. MA-2]
MQHFKVAARDEGISSVLIVDDHPLFSDALASALEGVFPLCRFEKARSLKHALKVLDDGFSPDLVMFDLKLPDVQGISGFVTMRGRVPDTPVLVISSLTSRALVHALMDEGASGFLTKDTPVEDLQQVLLEIANGRKHVPMEYRQNTVSDAPDAPGSDMNAKLAALTPQQKKVIKLICAGKPNKQIAYELQLAEATVKAHITALLRRLGVNNRTQAALMVEAANKAAAPGIEAEPEARNFLCH